MAISWTQNQQKAIDVRNKNVLVSAAAGSGKTAVLVERIRKLLSNGETEIDRILIATFTNAAAGEMRSRITGSLSKQLEEDCTNEVLRKQLVMFDRANIGTIHSFCQTMMRNNFHRLGIAADFKIADETEIAMLKTEAMEEVLEEFYLREDESFLWLADAYGGKKNDEGLKKLVLDIYAFSSTTKSPGKWLDKCRQMFCPTEAGEGIKTLPWAEMYIKMKQEEIENAVCQYEEILAAIKQFCDGDKYYNFLQDERDMLSGVLQSAKECNWDKLYETLELVVFNRIVKKPAELDAEIHEWIKATRDEIKNNYIKDMKAIVNAKLEQIISRTSMMYHIVNALCDLTLEVGKRYSVLKKEKKLVDFDDLEQYTIKLICENPDEFKNKFDHILIDEYQDINEAQDAIFNSLDNGSNIFVVGDVKQSIYGFRNTRPQLFAARASQYSSDNAEGETIFLSNNFRSSEKIINFANDTFKTVMSKTVGDVEYTENERLVFSGGGGDASDGAVELHIIEKKFDENDDLTEEDEQTDWVQREARLVASRIVKLIEFEKVEIYDKSIGQMRKAEYKDITILLRTTKNKSSIYAGELAALGIPVYSEESGSFTASIEIATMLSMLKVIDNPLQNIAMLGVLRSPVFGFTDDELVELKGKERRVSFFRQLKKSDSEKCKFAVKKIEEYTERATYMPVDELLRFILTDTGYESYVSAMPNSELRLMNLKLLCDRAGSYRSDGFKSVSDFVDYVGSFTDKVTFTMAKIISENDNAVRIMSIHKSKGLEFPIVFLVGTGAQFNEKDLQGNVLYDLDLGIGMDYIDARKRLSFLHLSKKVIAIKKRQQIKSEEMRILYVALTRPINKLFIYGSVGNIEREVRRLDKDAVYISGRLLPHYAQKQKTFLSWLYLSARTMEDLKINYHYASEILSENADSFVPESEEADKACEINQNIYDNINERFLYEYPFSASDIPSKLSVSQLLNSKTAEYTLGKPNFLHRTQKISGSTRGTIIHFVMQNLDISKTSSLDEIKMQIDEMVERDMITSEFAEVVDAEKINAFFNSDIGLRLKASELVMREYQFIAEFEACELIDTDEHEKILLQGVVDCFFEEADGLVVLDYKTGDAEENSERYANQLRLYSESIARIFKKQVKETHICAL